MNFTADALLEELERLALLAKPPRRYVVAFSGGLDSTVLLHALAHTRQVHSKPIVAVHVDHRLQPESAGWAERSAAFAARLGVEARCVAVDAGSVRGRGPEAAAREARYSALREHIEAGDWLLSAHHGDDQAETLLLNLLRGSGPAGIAGIPRIRRFADGWVARPLIDVPRAALMRYAARNELEWIDDPSNDSAEYDRNFLRSKVLPAFEDRWPNVRTRFGRSAILAREAAALLDDLADIDLEGLGDRPDRIDLQALRRLPAARQKNLLRRAVHRAGLPPVPSKTLDSIVDDVMPARADARPLARWQGAEARRFRNRLYLLEPGCELDFEGTALGAGPVHLGGGMGSLRLAECAGPGLSPDCVRDGLTLGRRKGGEKIKPFGQTHTRELKKLLQEEKVVPWMRGRLPLVYCRGRLVAVADLWLDDAAAVPDGWALQWTDRPAIH